MSSAEFQTCVRFYRECDENGSATWSISLFKIQIVYY